MSCLGMRPLPLENVAALRERDRAVPAPDARLAPDVAVADLVRAARAGDRAAFASLYHRFARVVHAVVLARVPLADAADLVQDAFVAAYERLGDVRDPAAFGGWLLQIARRRATDHLRARRATDELADDHAAAAPVPTAEARQALAAIRALPAAYRETLIMRLVEGLTGPEIAERTGLAPGSVRVNLHRGMMLLRERLGVRAGDPAEVEP
jgi:RNA polymerase sigma-70 factor, ECF subfamily